MWWNDLLIALIRLLSAVLIGGLIGTERAKHGRSAGMRTHILVCLGSAMTSITSVYVAQAFGGGDVLRIPAQVISGIGFLGAGMIILKNGNVITGLTTAAGVWTTATIGIALGYGYYAGALVVTILFLGAVVLLKKLEKRRRNFAVIYIEIDDMYKLNTIIKQLEEKFSQKFVHQVLPPKSNCQGHIGVDLVLENVEEVNLDTFCGVDGVVYASED